MWEIFQEAIHHRTKANNPNLGIDVWHGSPLDGPELGVLQAEFRKMWTF